VKIGVKSDNNVVIGSSIFQNRPIFGRRKTNISDMNSVDPMVF